MNALTLESGMALAAHRGGGPFKGSIELVLDGIVDKICWELSGADYAAGLVAWINDAMILSAMAQLQS